MNWTVSGHDSVLFDETSGSGAARVLLYEKLGSEKIEPMARPRYAAVRFICAIIDLCLPWLDVAKPLRRAHQQPGASWRIQAR